MYHKKYITSCIISFLYIKPQLDAEDECEPFGCIISFLYIKPQPSSFLWAKRPVVLYRFSTSNHNHSPIATALNSLYYIVSLHQTTTPKHQSGETPCCIISFLYIKPQQAVVNLFLGLVVLYRFSTSNHNLYHLHY